MYKCSKCNKELKTQSGKRHHENKCDGKGTKTDKKKANWGEIWNCPLCGLRIKSQRNKHVEYCNGLGPKRKREKKGKNWSKGLTKDTDDRILKISKSLIGISKGIASTPELEEIRKQKIRNSINERYANGWEVKCGRAKKYNYISNVAGEIKLDGKWELATAKYLDSIEITWSRNKKRFAYFNEIKNKNSTYCPDFYLNDLDIYIEVKGYTTELDKCKWKQFPNSLEIWNKEILISKNILNKNGTIKNASVAQLD